MNKPDDELLFVDEDDDLFAQDQDDLDEVVNINATAPQPSLKVSHQQPTAWKVIIVDDDEDVHQITRFVLDGYRYQNRDLVLLSAYSGQEALELLAKNEDTAVILLDVVMESHDAGLKTVQRIRDDLKNRFVRIILRTGQPGYAPEKEVIIKYDINDYKDKTELTDDKLFSAITTSLRSYSDMVLLELFRADLEQKVEERTRELQEKNQRLEQLNREKNEFLSIAAHDLKNPLFSIQGFSHLVKTSYDKLDKEQIREFMDLIESGSERMFLLIKNLLDVNMIELGNMNIALEAVDISSLIEHLLFNYKDKTQKKNITVTYQPLDNNQVFSDAAATQQVLDNLISNAIKYSPFDKEISIKLIDTDTHIRCNITDQGQGLSPAEQSKLFTKFTRLTPKPTDNEHSTGLGLFIVKKLIEAMHGTVGCQSEVGKGSCFYIELPKHHA